MDQDDKCFACGKAFRDGKKLLADTREDQKVFVGSACMKKIIRAGEAGYQPPLGGPRLYPVRQS